MTAAAVVVAAAALVAAAAAASAATATFGVSFSLAPWFAFQSSPTGCEFSRMATVIMSTVVINGIFWLSRMHQLTN